MIFAHRVMFSTIDTTQSCFFWPPPEFCFAELCSLIAPKLLDNIRIPGRHSVWVVYPSGAITLAYYPTSIRAFEDGMLCYVFGCRTEHTTHTKGFALSPLITDTFGSIHDSSGPVPC